MDFSVLFGLAGLIGTVVFGIMALGHSRRRTGQAGRLWLYTGISLVLFIVGLSLPSPAPATPAPAVAPATTTTAGTAPTATTTSPPAVPTQTQPAVPSYVMAVDKVVASQGGQMLQAPQGQKFLLVWLTLKNNTKDYINYSVWDFQLQDEHGNIVRFDLSAMSYLAVLNVATLGAGQLAPGGQVSGSIGFAVPASDKVFTLSWMESGLLSDRKRAMATITIK